MGISGKVLKSMGFPAHWVNLILNYVTSVSFSVMLNGSPCDVFKPERALKQKDPLTPYLFILCVEVLSSLMIKAQETQAIHGIRVAGTALEVTHLFFAYDNIAFF